MAFWGSARSPRYIKKKAEKNLFCVGWCSLKKSLCYTFLITHCYPLLFLKALYYSIFIYLCILIKKKEKYKFIYKYIDS